MYSEQLDIISKPKRQTPKVENHEVPTNPKINTKKKKKKKSKPDHLLRTETVDPPPLPQQHHSPNSKPKCQFSPTKSISSSSTAPSQSESRIEPHYANAENEGKKRGGKRSGARIL